MMTVREAAARLNVKQSTAYAAVGQGLLQCFRVRSRPGSRGVIRITEEQIQDYLRGPRSAKRLRHIR